MAGDLDLVVNFIVFAVVWTLPVVFIVLAYLGMRRDRPAQPEVARSERANVLPFRRPERGAPRDA